MGIVMKITFSSSVNCIFSFYLYPFDTQTCTLLFSITNCPPGYLDISLLERRISSIDKQIPLDYYLSGTSIGRDLDSGLIFYRFELTRYMVFPFLSVYIPTFMMLLIAYGTLWIPADDFQDRGTMSLTTLLVLISLYTQALNTLPVTPYVKLVDYWYLFCVLFISTIIFVHLASSKVDKIKYIDSLRKKYTLPSNERILTISKSCYGAILILYQITYWITLAVNLFILQTP